NMLRHGGGTSVNALLESYLLDWTPSYSYLSESNLVFQSVTIILIDFTQYYSSLNGTQD
ncbi:MAG: hypothetical protein ACI9VN_003184, partial [Patescibacteria group bacterium]